MKKEDLNQLASKNTEIENSERRKFFSKTALIGAASVPVTAALLSKSAKASELSTEKSIFAFDTIDSALNSTQLSDGDIIFVRSMETLSSSVLGDKEGTHFKVVLTADFPSQGPDIRVSNGNPSLSLQLINSDSIKASDLAMSAAGFERAREILITGHDEFTGGAIEVPVGRNFIDGEINIPIDGSNKFVNTTYKGVGKEASNLDFSKANALDNGVVIEGGAFYSMRDMSIFKAPQSGIFQSKSPGAWNHAYFADMRISANNQHGINSEQGFLGTYARVFSAQNSLHGFNMQGLHTSLSFDNCFAASNSGVGYKLNNLTYSSMHSCAADKNGEHGYDISNSHSLAINGCGSENNGKSGFSLLASAELGENKNISLNSIFAVKNNMNNTKSANLLHMKSLADTNNPVHINTATLTNSFAHLTKPVDEHGTVFYPIEDVIVEGEGAYLVEGYNQLPNGIKSKNRGYIQHLPKHTVVRDLRVPKGTSTPICNLMSTQGYSTTYGGELLIQVTNSDPSDSKDKNAAVYKLLVCKTAPATPFCDLILATGRTAGSGGSWPSFTWSINAEDQLVATPVNLTDGTFFFEVLATGFMKSTDL